METLFIHTDVETIALIEVTVLACSKCKEKRKGINELFI